MGEKGCSLTASFPSHLSSGRSPAKGDHGISGMNMESDQPAFKCRPLHVQPVGALAGGPS